MDKLDETVWVVWIGGLSMIVGCFCPWYRWSGSPGYGWIVLFLGLAAGVWAGLRAYDVVQDDAITIPDEFIYWGLAGLALVLVILRFVLVPSIGGYKPAYSIGIFFALFGAVAIAIGGLLGFWKKPAFAASTFTPVQVPTAAPQPTAATPVESITNVKEVSGVEPAPGPVAPSPPPQPTATAPVDNLDDAKDVGGVEPGQASAPAPVVAPEPPAPARPMQAPTSVAPTIDSQTSAPASPVAPVIPPPMPPSPAEPGKAEAREPAASEGKCPYCGDQLGPAAEFCVSCGKRIKV